MQRWNYLVGWLHTEMTHPKTVTHRNTNRTRRTVTSFMRRTTLTVMPRHQHTVIIRKMPSTQDRRQTVRVTTPARPHAFALRGCRMPLLCHAACLAALACICGRNGNLLLHPSINTYRRRHSRYWCSTFWPLTLTFTRFTLNPRRAYRCKKMTACMVLYAPGAFCLCRYTSARRTGIFLPRDAMHPRY